MELKGGVFMIEIPKFKPGLTETVQKLITEKDTALHFGSGALKTLLATPVLAALMIEAAAKMIDPRLPEGLITIGKSINITHEKPTPAGMTVTVKAELKEIDGNRLLFQLKAYDELGEIGHGIHERYIVSHSGILKSAEDRKKLLESKD